MRKALLLALALITLVALGIFVVRHPKALAATATYFVDCSQPNDGDGSQGNPWNSLADVHNHGPFAPGNWILLQGAVTCNGQLAPQGSGTSDNPIVIGTYNPGNGRAIINGNGVQPAAVYLNNQQYWEINGIEVTNATGNSADRVGIRVDNSTNGTLSHIHILNDYVHDVAGYTNGYFGDNGGITVNSVGTGGRQQVG